jgi:catechol-2,3-dioxygenase
MKVTGFNHLSIGTRNLEESVKFYQTVLGIAVDVDDFHAAYDAAKAMGALDSTAFRNPVNELPDGCVQMYLRDPAGNLVEIDWPDVETLDRSRIPEMKLLTEFAEQNEEGLAASLYLDRPHLKTARRAR